MSKELVIGSNRHETKVAVLEDDQLVEVYFQRANEYSLAGSIHKGRVTRVLPGMQSAFVDLGLERDTFLYVSDFFEEEEQDDIDKVVEEKPVRRERNGNRGGTHDRSEPDARQMDRREPEAPKLVRRDAERRDFERPILQQTNLQQSSNELELPAFGVTDIRREALETEQIGEPVTDEAMTAPFDRSETGAVEPRPSAGGSQGAGFQSGGLQNDRRGGRSRRRRPRQRGFPDNKYAQPGGGATETSPEPPVLPSRTNVTSSSSDVLLLPGESLAKYRNRPPEPTPELAAADAEDHAPYLSEELFQASDEPGFEEIPPDEIEDEAEEIALTDRILAHHDDDLSITDEEEKIAGVEGDQPAPDPPAEAAPPDFESIATVVLSDPGPPLEHEPSDFPFPLPTPAPLDEFEVLAIREGLPEDEANYDPANYDPASQEQAEETQSVIKSAEEENAEPADIAGGPVQTATVREPGGQVMHRASRRMRRRRGGNRSGHPRVESGTEVRPIEAPALITAAGAAVAPEARVETGRERSEERVPAERPDRVYPSIADLLKPGQEIIVQIAKEPLGQKGARITSHIALPGRFVVFMPSVNHLGVSRKVASDEERQRLKRILQAHRVGTTGGFIVRTAGEGIPEEEIAADMNFLYSLWLDIRQKAEKKPAPALLHYDLDVVQRILRDQVTEDFKAIWVDNEDLYENVLTFMQRFQPSLVSRVKMYTRSAPIFDAFNITQELEKALRPKVWLKSGGYIVINQTEALVAIDINTGKYVGKSNRLEDTIVKTNTEAVKEIVRQIRLRDLGGIIVVDFIDMDERKNRQKVMQTLEEAMRTDKAPYKILQFNDFGLVAITRKRVKQSLERTLCSPCPYCEGAGYVKSVQTVISEILVESQKLAKAIEGKDVVLRVHPDVAKVLKASSNQYLEEVEEILGRPVLVTGDPTLHHQKFDLA